MASGDRRWGLGTRNCLFPDSAPYLQFDLPRAGRGSGRRTEERVVMGALCGGHACAVPVEGCAGSPLPVLRYASDWMEDSGGAAGVGVVPAFGAVVELRADQPG